METVWAERNPLAPLDPDELRVLRYLCTHGLCVSSVVLTAELYVRATDARSDAPLWLLVESVLSDLNVRGLVTYRLGEHSIFTHIRVTRKAYPVAGLRNEFAHEVGVPYHPMGEGARHGPHDMTDFRNFNLSASSMGPIERMTLEEHVLVYREHAVLHREQLDELKIRRRKENYRG